MRDRVGVARNAELESRRIEHRREIVGHRRQFLDPLPDPGVVAVPADVAEDIEGDEHVVGRKPPSCLAHEARDRFHARGLGRDLRIGRSHGVGEADVVELDFVEAGRRGLFGDTQRVVPGLLAEGIDPAQPLAVLPDGTARGVDGPVRPDIDQQVVLEHHDARDEVDPLGLERGRKLLQVGNGAQLEGAGLGRERHLARIGNEAAVALEVDHERVEPALLDDFERRIEQERSTDPVDREIERLGRQGGETNHLEGFIAGGDRFATVAGGANLQGHRPSGDRELALCIGGDGVAAQGDDGLGDRCACRGVDDGAVPRLGEARPRQGEGDCRRQRCGDGPCMFHRLPHRPPARRDSNRTPRSASTTMERGSAMSLSVRVTGRRSIVNAAT